MKLDSLKIWINDDLIRDIQFNEGLSIITNKKGVGRTGNSVGKSTLSRIVDYLFLGAIDPIYIDEEFSKPNEKIESLFNESNVLAALSFIGINNSMHLIERNLCIDSSKCLFFFDENIVDRKEYETILQNQFFSITTRRPSIRSLVPKFIRNESHRMLNTTKFLDKHQGAKDYSELFIYLFGFQETNLLTEKRDAVNLQKRRKKYSESLNALVKEQKPKELISKYKTDIKLLEKQFLQFEYSPEYNDPITYLNKLQDRENQYTEYIFQTDRKLSNILNTIEMLSNEGGNYLSKELTAIYKYAGISIESGIRDFEEVLSFHDNLVAQKRQYLSIDLPTLQEQKKNYELELRSIQSEKIKVFAKMRSKEHIEKITERLKSLGELKVSLGKIEGIIDQQEKAKADYSRANQDLQDILNRIENEFTSVLKFEEQFNEELKWITDLVHAEEYTFNLNFNKEDGSCDLEIKNSSPNPEGGKKKAEVIAFDFAYIYAVNKIGINRPNFVFHDSIEDIDQKQINTLFQLARKLPGQQIVSFLSENLSDEMYKEYLKDTVLLLSDDDMFFKI